MHHLVRQPYQQTNLEAAFPPIEQVNDPQEPVKTDLEGRHRLPLITADWARDDHAVVVVDTTGRQVKRFTVTHSGAGLRKLISGLVSAGVEEIAIERPDGPVVEGLLAAGVTVVVISPNQLKNLRAVTASAGNKDDRFDAYVLADTLRTDRARLGPLTPDSSPTIALRAVCRARKDLVEHRVALANPLRAHPQRVFPGAVGLFAELDSPISLRFLGRFDCQDRADWLSASGWAPGCAAWATAVASIPRCCTPG